jgi:hypothetical protein
MAFRPGEAGRKPTPSRRPAAPGRRQPARQGGLGGVVPRRRPQKKASGMSAAVGALKGALPTGGSSTSKSSGRGKKGAGLALATAAAGLAVSNRDKLGSLLGRDKGAKEEIPPTTPVTTPAGTTGTGMPGGTTGTGMPTGLPEDDRPGGPSSPAA